jgi:hypothetical protein
MSEWVYIIGCGRVSSRSSRLCHCRLNTPRLATLHTVRLYTLLKSLCASISMHVFFCNTRSMHAVMVDPRAFLTLTCVDRMRQKAHQGKSFLLACTHKIREKSGEWEKCWSRTGSLLSRLHPHGRPRPSGITTLLSDRDNYKK